MKSKERERERDKEGQKERYKEVYNNKKRPQRYWLSFCTYHPLWKRLVHLPCICSSFHFSFSFLSFFSSFYFSSTRLHPSSRSTVPVSLCVDRMPKTESKGYEPLPEIENVLTILEDLKKLVGEIYSPLPEQWLADTDLPDAASKLATATSSSSSSKTIPAVIGGTPTAHTKSVDIDIEKLPISSIYGPPPLFASDELSTSEAVSNTQIGTGSIENIRESIGGARLAHFHPLSSSSLRWSLEQQFKEKCSRLRSILQSNEVLFKGATTKSSARINRFLAHSRDSYSLSKYIQGRLEHLSKCDEAASEHIKLCTAKDQGRLGLYENLSTLLRIGKELKCEVDVEEENENGVTTVSIFSGDETCFSVEIGFKRSGEIASIEVTFSSDEEEEDEEEEEEEGEGKGEEEKNERDDKAGKESGRYDAANDIKQMIISKDFYSLKRKLYLRQRLANITDKYPSHSLGSLEETAIKPAMVKLVQDGVALSVSSLFEGKSLQYFAAPRPELCVPHGEARHLVYVGVEEVLSRSFSLSNTPNGAVSGNGMQVEPSSQSSTIDPSSSSSSASPSSTQSFDYLFEVRPPVLVPHYVGHQLHTQNFSIKADSDYDLTARTRHSSFLDLLITPTMRAQNAYVIRTTEQTCSQPEVDGMRERRPLDFLTNRPEAAGNGTTSSPDYEVFSGAPIQYLNFLSVFSDYQHIYETTERSSHSAMQGRGYIVSEIPVKSLSSLPDITRLLQRQVLFNTLFRTCFATHRVFERKKKRVEVMLSRESNENESNKMNEEEGDGGEEIDRERDGLIDVDPEECSCFEIQAEPPNYISVGVSHPLSHNRMNIQFVIGEENEMASNPLSCVSISIVQHRNDPSPCSEEYAKKILKESWNIPVVLHFILQKASSS